MAAAKGEDAMGTAKRRLVDSYKAIRLAAEREDSAENDDGDDGVARVKDDRWVVIVVAVTGGGGGGNHQVGGGAGERRSHERQTCDRTHLPRCLAGASRRTPPLRSEREGVPASGFGRAVEGLEPTPPAPAAMPWGSSLVFFGLG